MCDYGFLFSLYFRSFIQVYPGHTRSGSLCICCIHAWLGGPKPATESPNMLRVTPVEATNPLLSPCYCQCAAKSTPCGVSAHPHAFRASRHHRSFPLIADATPKWPTEAGPFSSELPPCLRWHGRGVEGPGAEPCRHPQGQVGEEIAWRMAWPGPRRRGSAAQRRRRRRQGPTAPTSRTSPASCPDLWSGAL